MERKSVWLSLLAVGFIVLGAVAARADTHSTIGYQTIEGPVAPEVDATRVAVDCFYTDNRELAQCLEQVGGAGAIPSPSIEGLVPAEEDRTRLAVDCFYTANRTDLPCG
jgi:hypothetical protein